MNFINDLYGYFLNVFWAIQTYYSNLNDRFIFALNKLEEETEKKWEGNFVWYLDNEEISFEASNGFEGENKLWRRLDY